MNKSNAYRTSILGILSAIIILQSIVPMLGYLPLGFVNLTIIHITVIIAAVVLGPNDGAIVGLIWGISTLIRAYTSPTSPLDTSVFTNPIITIIPRVLVGWFSGWTYKILKLKFNSLFSSGVAGAVGSITNTGLVLLLMRVMFKGALLSAYKVSSTALNGIFMSIILANGIPEMIAATILVPIISIAIFKTNKFLNN